jgi:hypothetical protein
MPNPSLRRNCLKQLDFPYGETDPSATTANLLPETTG